MGEFCLSSFITDVDEFSVCEQDAVLRPVDVLRVFRSLLIFGITSFADESAAVH